MGLGNNLLASFKKDRKQQRATDLYLFGFTQYQIAVKLKVDVSTVSRWLKEVREEFQKKSLESHETLVNEKIAELRVIRREAYLAWIESKKPHKQLYKRLEKDGTGAMVIVELTKELSKRLPSNQFLHTILETIRMEMSLLGLEAPDEVNVKQQIVKLDWSTMLSPPSKDRPTTDDMEKRIEQIKALPEAAASSTQISSPENRNGKSHT